MLARYDYDAERDGRPGLLIGPHVWVHRLHRDVAELKRYRFALANLVRSRFVGLYQRSALGFLWTLLNPLLHLTALSVVFSLLLQRPLLEFTLYLFAGQLPWQFVAATLAQGSASLIAHQGVLRKIYVPKLLFPLTAVVINIVNLAFAMVALFLLLQVVGAPVFPQIVLLPAALALIAVFALGLSLVLVVIGTIYRDVEHILGVLLHLWFFLSPVLWKPSELARHGPVAAVLIAANPMTHFLELFHCIFCYGTWPPASAWLITGGLSAAALLLGYAVFTTAERRLVFHL
jgi:ABC-type polysaccharide/polyol phosphate export permease